MNPRLDRRTMLGLAAATGLVGLAGCGRAAADPQTTDPQTTRTGPWSHTLNADQRTIELDHLPQRLVVDTYALGALWPYGIRPVGYWGYSAEDRTTVGVTDLTTMTQVGSEAEFDLEQVAALGTELIIGYSMDGVGWPWWANDEVATQAARIAPFVPISFNRLDTVGLIEEYRGLARSLGADTGTDQIRADQQAFEDSLARLASLAAAKSLRVLALQANVDGLYIGVHLRILDLLREQGVQIVEATPLRSGGPWAQVSWEQISSYRADLILDFEETSPDAHDNPLWRRLPAVAAGQLAEWNDKRANHYGNYAAWLAQLADAYEAAEPVG